MDMARFGQVLKQVRDERGLSQEALAQRAPTADGEKPISPMTVSAIERGANLNPTISTVVRLIEALPMTLSSFFARLELSDGDGLPGKDQGPINRDATHDASSPFPFLPSDRQLLATLHWAIGQKLADLTERASAREPEADRGLAPETRSPTPEHGDHIRRSPPRHARRAKTRRPRKR